MVGTSKHSPLAATTTLVEQARSKWWLTSLIVFVIAYGVVNLLYSFSTQKPMMPVILDQSDRAVVSIQPYGVVPAEDLLKIKVTLQVPPQYLDDITLTRDIDVVLLTEDRTLTFKKGARSLTQETTLLSTNGSYESYPFDRYTEFLAVTVLVTDDVGKPQALPTDAVVWGKFPGWRVMPSASAATDTDLTPVAQPWNEEDVALVNLDLARNGSTMSYVVLLLVAMIFMAVLALTVSHAVATRRRKIEATMASWFAALLFAMVPLRTNMPGAPPIGVWMDFLVFLWVLLALMIALAIFISSWLRYSPRLQDAASSLAPGLGVEVPKSDRSDANS